MRANQNSSTELGLYSKIDPMPSFLIWPRSHSYSKIIGHRNQVRNRETQWKTMIDASKIKCEPTETKIELTSNSSSHMHPIEHLVGVVLEQLRESNLNYKTSIFLI
jgi:hypothetical protein